MARMTYTWTDETQQGVVTIHTGAMQGEYPVNAQTQVMNGVVSLTREYASSDEIITHKVSLRDSLPGLGELLRQARRFV